MNHCLNKNDHIHDYYVWFRWRLTWRSWLRWITQFIMTTLMIVLHDLGNGQHGLHHDWGEKKLVTNSDHCHDCTAWLRWRLTWQHHDWEDEIYSDHSHDCSAWFRWRLTWPLSWLRWRTSPDPARTSSATFTSKSTIFIRI